MTELQEPIIAVTDILEQIQSVNVQVMLHKEANDPFMFGQYESRKKELLKSLSELLNDLEITPNDLAA